MSEPILSETGKPQIDHTKEFVVSETFTGKIVGAFDTLDEARDEAMKQNVTAVGDSVFVIAKVVGVVKLMKFEEVNHKPGPAPQKGKGEKAKEGEAQS